MPNSQMALPQYMWTVYTSFTLDNLVHSRNGIHIVEQYTRIRYAINIRYAPITSEGRRSDEITQSWPLPSVPVRFPLPAFHQVYIKRDRPPNNIREPFFFKFFVISIVWARQITQCRLDPIVQNSAVGLLLGLQDSHCI